MDCFSNNFLISNSPNSLEVIAIAKKLLC
jgi:hypothetical protein